MGPSSRVPGGHGGGRDSGDRLDLAVEVGLVDVAAPGGNARGAVTRREKVSGVVEARQLRGAFGCEADLGSEAGPQALAAPADLVRQAVDPYPPSAGDRPPPGVGDPGIDRGAGAQTPAEDVRRDREPFAHDVAARSLSSTCPAPRAQTSSRDATVPVSSVDAPSTAAATTGDNRIWRHFFRSATASPGISTGRAVVALIPLRIIASDRLGQRSGPSGGASRARRMNGCGRSASRLGPVLISTSDPTRSGRCSASAVAT